MFDRLSWKQAVLFMEHLGKAGVSEQEVSMALHNSDLFFPQIAGLLKSRLMKKKITKRWKGQRVRDLPLSIRIRNCLEANGIFSVGQIVKLTPENLLDIDGFMLSTVMQLSDVLEQIGLRLKDE